MPGRTGEMTMRDIASELYEQINFLTIRKSVKSLIEQDQSIIEEFVRHYSIIVIYFLNILDSELTRRLLERLTNNSILYLIEEELRTILIRKIAGDDVDLEMLSDLSAFMDHVDNPDPDAEIHESSARVLDILVQARLDEGRKYFGYLQDIPEKRRDSIVRFLLNRNKHAALALLVFGNDDILKETLDTIAFHQSRNLRYVPVEIFLRRFQRNYNLYLNRKIQDNLPRSVIELLQHMEKIQSRYGSFMDEIAKNPHTRNSRQGREKILDTVYEMIEYAGKPGVKKMILQELIRKGAINSKEVQLLESIKH